MKQNSHNLVTLKDIAVSTGYSVNTVSRALRGKDDIARDTAAKIKKTAAKMGYISNAAASALRSGRSNTIAVILGDVSNPYFSIMMKEIEHRARADGYSSFLINTNENSKMEKEAIQIALNKKVDGLIISPSQHNDSNIRYLMKTRIPFVLVGRYFEHLTASSVVCNDEMGGYLAVKYLLNNGHRNILMLNGPSYISSARERLAGYERAFFESKLKVNPQLIREVPITGGGSSIIEKILQEKIHFSAIFAFSDVLAWDAWSSLRKKGFRIPEDYSLIGFDNIQSRFEIPFQLSTIGSHKEKLSNAAVECLLRIIRDRNNAQENREESKRLIIGTRLIPGETVRRIEIPEITS